MAANIRRAESNDPVRSSKDIRHFQQFDIDEKTIVEWGINDKGEPEVNFRKKVELTDIIGIVKTDEVTDSVELKKGVYK